MRATEAIKSLGCDTDQEAKAVGSRCSYYHTPLGDQAQGPSDVVQAIWLSATLMSVHSNKLLSFHLKSHGELLLNPH